MGSNHTGKGESSGVENIIKNEVQKKTQTSSTLYNIKNSFVQCWIDGGSIL